MMMRVDQVTIFLDSNINNSYGSMSAYIQTTNNDTYMRKNKINKLTVLESGLSFERDDMNNYFSIDTIGYKHLAIQMRKWEYIYPRLRYNINNIDDNILNGSMSVQPV